MCQENYNLEIKHSKEIIDCQNTTNIFRKRNLWVARVKTRWSHPIPITASYTLECHQEQVKLQPVNLVTVNSAMDIQMVAPCITRVSDTQTCYPQMKRCETELLEICKVRNWWHRVKLLCLFMVNEYPVLFVKEEANCKYLWKLIAFPTAMSL